MKATLAHCLAKRSIVLAAAALPSFYSVLAQAQVPPPAAPAAAPAPPPAAPPPPAAAPMPAPAEPAATAPAVVTPPAPETPPAPPAVPPPAPADAPPPPMSAEEEKYKHINMGIWMRVEGVLQNQRHPEKMDRASTNGEVEFHFSNQMRKYFQWTANIVATYGGGSVDGTGSVGILDLIAQLEPDPAFHIWAGRMLVASDRSNFSGPYFMGPWNYPGAYGSGPKEGPFGRNDGATIWGQAGGGVLKYYVGGQYQKELLSPGVYTDYELFNADLLFEKELMGSGVVDVEGALFAYSGDAEDKKISYFALASYLTPETGIGKFQPLVRIQQSTPKASGAETGTSIDAQLGYVLDSYSTRFALGYEHTSAVDTIGGGSPKSQQLFLGVQIQK